MKNVLEIKMELPFQDNVGIVFNKWLPLFENGISKQEAGLKITLYFDKNCMRHPEYFDNIEVLENVQTTKINAVVLIDNVSNSLFKHISNVRGNKQIKLDEEFNALAEKVYKTTLLFANQLISFFRNQCGQFWLKKFPVDVGNEVVPKNWTELLGV